MKWLRQLNYYTIRKLKHFSNVQIVSYILGFAFSKNLSYICYLAQTPTSTGQYLPVFSPILINCPHDIVETAELGTSEIAIQWTPPIAINQYGSVAIQHASHSPGDTFLVGYTALVSYLFGDGVPECNFSVSIREGIVLACLL